MRDAREHLTVFSPSMQYPTLDRDANFPTIAFLPVLYPGADPVTNQMSVQYHRFHQTWVGSADWQAQTAGVGPIRLSQLPHEHDWRLHFYAVNGGYSPGQLWQRISGLLLMRQGRDA